MPLIEALLLLLVLSRALGEIAGRFGQPAMIGEIAAGVLLGPSVLGYVHFTPEIRAIADIGVLLLAFLVGMEMDMDALWASCRGRGAWVSAAGFVVPLGLGILIGWGFGLIGNGAGFYWLVTVTTLVADPSDLIVELDVGPLEPPHPQTPKAIKHSRIARPTFLLLIGLLVKAESINLDLLPIAARAAQLELASQFVAEPLHNLILRLRHEITIGESHKWFAPRFPFWH